MPLNARLSGKSLRLAALPLLAVAALAAYGLVGFPLAEAQSSPSAQPRLISTFTCTIAEVGVFAVDPRIHVKCTAAATGGIDFFAFPTDTPNAVAANQLLSVANASFALGRDVVVLYDEDSGNNPTGCLPANCRALTGMVTAP